MNAGYRVCCTVSCFGRVCEKPSKSFGVRRMKWLLMIIRKIFYLGIILYCSSAYSASPEYIVSSKEVFAHPHDLDLDPTGQWLFVADVNHHDIKVLNAKTLEIITAIGAGELDSPHDVHFDDQGRLLVADSGNDRIAIYTLDDLKATLMGELAEGMSSPEGVTSAPGNTIFIASTGNHKILKFKNGKLVKAIGERGDAKLQFVRPHDIELGPDGLLYIGDPGNSRIQILTESLLYNNTLQLSIKPFDEPKYLALDQDNKLFVADQHNNMLRIFDVNRREVAAITNAGGKSLNYIEGVEAHNGAIWISDTYNNRIVLFRWEP